MHLSEPNGSEMKSLLTRNYFLMKNLLVSVKKPVILIAEVMDTLTTTLTFPAMKPDRIRFILPFHFISASTIQWYMEFSSIILLHLISTSVQDRRGIPPFLLMTVI